MPTPASTLQAGNLGDSTDLRNANAPYLDSTNPSYCRLTSLEIFSFCIETPEW